MIVIDINDMVSFTHWNTVGIFTGTVVDMYVYDGDCYLAVLCGENNYNVRMDRIIDVKKQAIYK